MLILPPIGLFFSIRDNTGQEGGLRDFFFKLVTRGCQSVVAELVLYFPSFSLLALRFPANKITWWAERSDVWFSFWDAMVAFFQFWDFWHLLSHHSCLFRSGFSSPITSLFFSAVPFGQLLQMVMGSSPTPFCSSGSGTNEQWNGRKHFIGPSHLG